LIPFFSRLFPHRRVVDSDHRHVFLGSPNAAAIVTPNPWPGSLVPDYVLQSVNPAFERQFGVQGRRLQGTLLSTWSTVPLEGFLGRFDLVLSTGDPDQMDCFSPTLGRWYDLRAYRGLPGHLILLFLDITDRRAQEKKAEEESLRFRSFFELGSVKLVIEPESQRILEANAQASRFYGWTNAELKAMTIAQINTLEPDDLEAEMAQAREASRTFFRFRHRLKNGLVRDVEVHTAPGQWGAQRALFSIVHDTTEVNLFRQQILRQERLARIGTLTASLVHEVGNVLGAIRAEVSALGGGTAPPPIERQFERAKILMDGMRQLTAGQDLPRQATTGRALLAAAGEALTARCLRAGVPLLLSPGPADLEAFVNPTFFLQVLENLVLNALQALVGTPHPEVRITAVAEAGWLVVRVANNGPPVDADLRARLFLPFQTSRPDRGSGLGLYFCRLVVELHGGRICLEELPQTSFRIEVPGLPSPAGPGAVS